MPTLLNYWRCDDDSVTTMSDSQASPAKDGKYTGTVTHDTTGPLPSDPDNTLVTLDGTDGRLFFNNPDLGAPPNPTFDNNLRVNPDEGSFLFWMKPTRPSTDFNEFTGTQRFEEFLAIYQADPHCEIDLFRSVVGANDHYYLWRTFGGYRGGLGGVGTFGTYASVHENSEEVLITATVNPILFDEWVAVGITWSASAGTMKILFRRDGTTTVYDTLQEWGDDGVVTPASISAFGSVVPTVTTGPVLPFPSWIEMGIYFDYVPPQGAFGQFKHYGTALTQTEIEQEWLRWDYTDIPYGTADFAQLQFIPSAIQGRPGTVPFTLYWVRNGELVDLTDCTGIIGRIKPRWGTTRFVSGLISVDADPTSGTFTFLPSSDDVQSAGDYKVEFVASFPDGDEAMFFDWSIRIAI